MFNTSVKVLWNATISLTSLKTCIEKLQIDRKYGFYNFKLYIVGIFKIFYLN